jgi:hypothetical protein
MRGQPPAFAGLNFSSSAGATSTQYSQKHNEFSGVILRPVVDCASCTVANSPPLIARTILIFKVPFNTLLHLKSRLNCYLLLSAFLKEDPTVLGKKKNI